MDLLDTLGFCSGSKQADSVCQWPSHVMFPMRKHLIFLHAHNSSAVFIKDHMKLWRYMTSWWIWNQSNRTCMGWRTAQMYTKTSSHLLKEAYYQCRAWYAATFFHLPHSHEKIVATSKHVLPIRLFLSPSPQLTQAQVQTSKSIFQLQMKKHRRLQQIMITKGGNRIN